MPRFAVERIAVIRTLKNHKTLPVGKVLWFRGMAFIEKIYFAPAGNAK